MNQRVTPLFLLLAAFVLTACHTTGGGRSWLRLTAWDDGTGNGSNGVRRQHVVTEDELRQRLMGYADSYLSRMSETTDILKANAKDPETRLAAHVQKLSLSTAAITIASETFPEESLLNMMVLASLDRIVWGDGMAESVFGQDAPVLLEAQKSLEADIWSLGGEILTADQLAIVRQWIMDWRVDNPDRFYISYLRFDDIGTIRGRQKDSLHLFSVLQQVVPKSPLEGTNRAVDEVRSLGERALFVGQRMPLLMNWQAEMLLLQVAVAPETRQILGAVDSVTLALDRLEKDFQSLQGQIAIERKAMLEGAGELLAREREALTAELGRSSAELARTAADLRAAVEAGERLVPTVTTASTDARATLVELRETAAALDETMRLFDQVSARFDTSSAPGAASARPFDITEYTAAAREAASAARELTTALEAADRLAQPERLDPALRQADAAVRATIDHAFRWAVALVILFWALGFVVIAGLRRFGRRPPPT